MGDLDATPERQLIAIPGPNPDCHHVVKRPPGADRVAQGDGPAAGAAQVAQRPAELVAAGGPLPPVLGVGGLSPAGAQTRHGKTHATAAPDATLRDMWQREARETGIDPDQLAAAALPGRPESAAAEWAVQAAPGDPAADPEAEPRQGREEAALRAVRERILDP